MLTVTARSRSRLLAILPPLVLSIGLFAAITFFGGTCDQSVRSERNYVIAALVIPFTLSFIWLLYAGARAIASSTRLQALVFAVAGHFAVGLIGAFVLTGETRGWLRVLAWVPMWIVGPIADENIWVDCDQ